MRVGPYDFSPGAVPTVLAVFLIALFVWLGGWQSSRAVEKRALLSLYAERTQAPPVPIDFGVPDLSTLSFRHAEAFGRYDVGRQLLLDNQIRDGRAGYQVLTPLVIPGRAEALLVDRGWVPQGATRQDLPDLRFDAGAGRVVGTLYVPLAEGYRMGDLDAGQQGWPRVIQYLDFEAISSRLGYPVAPFVLRLDTDEPHGYRRDWAPIALTPDRHVAYAVQWFAMALAILSLYVILNLKRSPGDGP